MSGAEQRANFASIGRDLLAARGCAGERRGLALSGSSDDVPPQSFARLHVVPDWLRWSRDKQAALARAVALRALAPALAASIDGSWLGRLARVAGEEALDWAIASAGDQSETPGDTDETFVPEDLTAVGFATLRNKLPDDLRAYVFSVAANPLPADAAMIADATAYVQATHK